MVVIYNIYLDDSQHLPLLDLGGPQLLLQPPGVLLQSPDVLHGCPQDGALILPHVLHQAVVPEVLRSIKYL